MCTEIKLKLDILPALGLLELDWRGQLGLAIGLSFVGLAKAL